MQSSRKGKRIGRKACDRCRDRKVQCVSEGSELASCRKCIQVDTPCTFLKDRKPRGPPSQRPILNPPLPIGDITVEHFCTRDVFLEMLSDYLSLVFPVLPLVHRTSFRELLEQQAFNTSPEFFRSCVSLCAVTVASIPRNLARYGGERYADVGSMVNRASQVVLLSRMISEPQWQSKPTIGTMLTSVVLAMASHYAGLPSQGWSYVNEAIGIFRARELYREASYEGFGCIQTELCKRAFWVLYIIQIHDRLSFVVPHTGMSYDPTHTDWEFLLPVEVPDEDLSSGVYHSPATNETQSRANTRPLISGFIALIKVFLCVVDLISNGFPGSAPQAYAMSYGSLGHLLPSVDPEGLASSPQSTEDGNSKLNLSVVLRTMKRLKLTLEELPPELKMSRGTSQIGTDAGYQFDIMRANIHITCLYLQSTILETCFGSSRLHSLEEFLGVSLSAGRDPSSCATATAAATIARRERPLRAELWELRQSIAQELLELLNFCSSWTLEANGSSMIIKIREIAATLLDRDDGSEMLSGLEERSRQYVQRFVQILADIDYSSRPPGWFPMLSTGDHAADALHAGNFGSGSPHHSFQTTP